MSWNVRWELAGKRRVSRCLAAAAMMWLGLGWPAVLSAADLLRDREAIRQKVDEVVRPFLHEAVSKADGAANGEIDSKREEAATGEVRGRAWAIVVGVTGKEGRHVFGYGRLAADSDQPADGRTLFEIGSVTKTFTAVLLADLAEQGKLKLDDPVRQHLRDEAVVPKRGDREITLLELATHTSGLPRIPTSIGLRSLFSMNPYKEFGAEDLYRTLAATEIGEGPAEYSYSNLGYAVLGHVLCGQAGCDYEELVIERVCKPLGLRDTRIELDDEQRKRFAAPYTALGTPAAHWDFDAFAGAGALRSTADDMLTYVEANMGLRKCDLLPAMRRSHETRHPAAAKTQSIGLGWHAQKMPRDARLVFHGGGTGGYSSLVGFVEEDGEPTFGLAVLANAAPGGEGMVANDVAVKLLDVLRDSND